MGCVCSNLWAGVRNQLAQHAVYLAIRVFWLPTGHSTGLVFLVGSLGGDLVTVHLLLCLARQCFQREVGCVSTGGRKGRNEETHKCFSYQNYTIF